MPCSVFLSAIRHSGAIVLLKHQTDLSLMIVPNLKIADNDVVNQTGGDKENEKGI